MPSDKNYYLILGVRRSATIEQIEKAHREKLKFYHPDRWRDNESMYRQAEEESKAINEAYYHLSDPIRRSKYDARPTESNTGYQREEARRNQAQDARRRAEQAASEEAARRKAEQERQRQAAEASKRKAEAERRRRAAEAAQRKKEQERQQQYAEAAKRKEEQERRRAAETEKRKAEAAQKFEEESEQQESATDAEWHEEQEERRYEEKSWSRPTTDQWRAAAEVKQRQAQADQLRQQDKSTPAQKYAGLILGAGILSFAIGVFSISVTWRSSGAVQPTVQWTHIPTELGANYYATWLPSVPTRPPDCIRWSQVTRSHVGRTLCVYGTVASIYSTNESWSRINFSDQPNTFFMYDTFYTYTDLGEGDCLQTRGKVELFDNTIPYIAVSDNLHYCEDWMK